MIVAGLCAIQRYLESNGLSVLRGAQNHLKIAGVEPEDNLAGRRLECASLGADVPRSAESH
jgi:hypothetical protein